MTGESDRDRFWREVSEAMHAGEPAVPLTEGRAVTIPAGRPWLTEAEYAATIPARMNEIAGEMNERLADVLPPGMRFEWTTEDRHDA